jgi:hypothetical protein
MTFHAISGRFHRGTVALLTGIAEARGMAEVFPRQNPEGLETLRRVAMIQSAEASNAIENIYAPRARIGVSDAHISKVLSELKRAGIIEPLGTGRGARWRRLRGPTEIS